MNYKVYQKLAQLQNARMNCLKSHNDEWLDKHEEEMENIVKNNLPSGSGIDSGNTFDYENSNDDKLVINSSFHAMNENGYYENWIDYKVIITPSLFHGFYIRIVGKFGRKQDIKDYLTEIYSNALEELI